jgi:hypothetical protein
VFRGCRAASPRDEAGQGCGELCCRNVAGKDRIVRGLLRWITGTFLLAGAVVLGLAFLASLPVWAMALQLIP